MSKKDKFYMALAVLIGIGMVVVGIVMLSSDGVQCGSREMKAGDSCTTVSKNDTSTERNYEEESAKQTRTSWILIGIGVVLGGGGGAFLLTGNGKKKAQVPQQQHPQQVGYPQQAPPQYGQQSYQQYPPQQQPPMQYPPQQYPR